MTINNFPIDSFVLIFNFISEKNLIYNKLKTNNYFFYLFFNLILLKEFKPFVYIAYKCYLKIGKILNQIYFFNYYIFLLHEDEDMCHQI